MQNQDEDMIPLEGYEPPTGPQKLALCWSCQTSKPLNKLAELSGDFLLPCCLTCWEKMPVADRLRIGRELATYAAQNEANEALTRAADIFVTKVSQFATTLDELKKLAEGDDDSGGADFSWLTGRRN